MLFMAVLKGVISRNVVRRMTSRPGQEADTPPSILLRSPYTARQDLKPLHSGFLLLLFLHFSRGCRRGPHSPRAAGTPSQKNQSKTLMEQNIGPLLQKISWLRIWQKELSEFRPEVHAHNCTAAHKTLQSSLSFELWCFQRYVTSFV